MSVERDVIKNKTAVKTLPSFEFGYVRVALTTIMNRESGQIMVFTWAKMTRLENGSKTQYPNESKANLREDLVPITKQVAEVITANDSVINR